MKGIALSTLAYIILAVASLVVILSLLGNKIYPSVKNAYCNILFGIKSFLPLPTNMKTDIPMFCQKQEDQIKIITEEIKSSDPESIAFQIAAYSKACWEKTANVYYENVVCYELTIKRISDQVTEEMVKNYLGKDSDILSWHVDIIDRPKSIGIVYNAQENKIEVR